LRKDAGLSPQAYSQQQPSFPVGDLLDDKARENAPSVIHLFDFKARFLSMLPSSKGMWSVRNWSQLRL
jgi:hypothetical protein